MNLNLRKDRGKEETYIKKKTKLVDYQPCFSQISDDYEFLATLFHYFTQQVSSVKCVDYFRPACDKPKQF